MTANTSGIWRANMVKYRNCKTELEKEYPGVAEISLSSARKMMTTIVAEIGKLIQNHGERLRHRLVRYFIRGE